MSKERAAGPENSQSCQIMGNTEAAWEKYYDLNFSVRESQLAVNATSGEWRAAMLQKGEVVRSVYEEVD